MVDNGAQALSKENEHGNNSKHSCIFNNGGRWCYRLGRLLWSASAMIGYNTGKMVIGCHYEPPKRDYNSDLSVWWQGILLGRKKSLKERFMDFMRGEQ